MAIVISSRKVESWLQDPAFIAAFPEFLHTKQQYTQQQVALKARGLCTSCASMRGIFPRVLLQLKNNVSLIRRLKVYLGDEKLQYVDHTGGKAEVRLL